MKNILILALCVTFFNAYSVDRVVQQNGPVGTYNSINAAVTAAVDGDVIIVNNRLDLLPWQEDIIIEKSLTFISAQDTTLFFVNGLYTITPASGREVKILGMRNTASTTNITVSSNSGVLSTRTKISILDGELSGGINTAPGAGTINPVQGTDLYLGNSNVGNSVEFSYGKLIGNKINGNLVLYSDSTNNNDSLWIVGNDFLGAVSNSVIYNNSQYLMVFNNWFYVSNKQFNIFYLKSGQNTSLFINNVFGGFPSTYVFFENVPVSSGSKFLFTNNIFFNSNNTNYSCRVYDANNKVNYHYNISGSSGLLSSLGNIHAANLGLSSFNTNRSNNFSIGTDAGNPLNEYLDLDLTRNDIGVYGGSYSFANFHPITDGKSARVSFVKTPRVINQGDTFRVDVIGFDK